MKTLFLSKYLEVTGRSDVVTSKWGEHHPAPADFHCVVLDMKLDLYVDPDNPEIGYHGYPFYSLFDDVARLLDAGGVVICLNHYTYVNQNSIYRRGETPEHELLLVKKQRIFNYEYKYGGKEETCYDWLEQGFLQVTRIDQMKIRPGENYKLLSNIEPLRRYFQRIREYHKVIRGVQNIEHEANTWSGEIRWQIPADLERETFAQIRDKAEILAVTEVTNEPIAAAINYHNFLGTLVLLPTYEMPPADVEDSIYNEIINSVSWALADLGEHYYELKREELGIQLEAPPWLLKYRVKPALEADKELAELETAKTAALAKRERHDRMLALINGYGEPLEKAVRELFGKEWLGFDVEKTERDHSIDLFVKNPKTGQTLAVQVTGVSGRFNRRDRHFGAVMGYLPEHEEKNIDSRVERIVLVVNPYRETPLDERIAPEDITSPVRNLVRDNHICLIRSCDLYDLWKVWVDSPDKLSPDDIFKQWFDCEGIWQRKQTPRV